MEIYCKDMDEFAKRFWSKVLIKGEDECWEWQNATQSRGYGSVGIGRRGKTALAHRVAYFLTYGDPGELCVLHSCDNRRCVNPKHLFLGTNQDNVDDKVKKGRQLIGEENGNSKLTAKEVEEIRELYRVKKIPYRKLGGLFGVSESTVMGIVKGEYWKLPLAE